MEKPKIDGIKLSNELMQVILRGQSQSTNLLHRFCQCMSDHEINMPFISTTISGGVMQVCCCLEVVDESELRDIIDSQLHPGEQTDYIPSVGLLSVFPHQKRFMVLGSVLLAFAEARLPLYGLASSLSAITFITDYSLLDRAAASLEDYLVLPPGHRPIKAQIRVEQSRITKA